MWLADRHSEDASAFLAVNQRDHPRLALALELIEQNIALLLGRIAAGQNL